MSAIPDPLRCEFELLDSAKAAVQAFVMDCGESFIVSHADRTRYILACRNTICKFTIRISVLKGSKISVTRYTPHTCSPIIHQNFRSAHSVAYLLERNRSAVADNREIQPAQIQSNELLQFANSGVSYQQAWRVREALREEIEGDEIGGFRKFRGLIDLWREGDEKNHGILDTVDGQFYRCFIAPAATSAAFISCRPFIALDGCHTKARFRMTLLVACTLDGNNEILPLAWGVVPIEDSENWIWFLKHMKHAFQELDTKGTVIISDHDKGLLSAVQEVLPHVNHSYCSQHLADNVQKHYGFACRNLFWGAAYAYTEHGFQEGMKKVREENQEAYDYLNEILHML